jgi:hypothetical protein
MVSVYHAEHLSTTCPLDLSLRARPGSTHAYCVARSRRFGVEQGVWFPVVWCDKTGVVRGGEAIALCGANAGEYRAVRCSIRKSGVLELQYSMQVGNSYSKYQAQRTRQSLNIDSASHIMRVFFY